MKFHLLVIVGMVIFFSLGCTKEIKLTPINNQPQSVENMDNSVPASESSKTLEYRIHGKVSFVTENGISYLEFDKSFKTENRPDLFLNLYHANTPPKYGIKEKDYARIAPLQRISGSQLYALPNNVKLANFGFLAMWCRSFNVSFGYAGLPK
jgi:hypothetical protein